MRIIKTEIVQETRKTSLNPKIAHVSRTETTQKIIKKEAKVIVDSIDQRYELADFLKSKNFKQTDGMVGETKDFGVWTSINNGVTEEYLILSFHNQKCYERLIQTVINWSKK